MRRRGAAPPNPPTAPGVLQWKTTRRDSVKKPIPPSPPHAQDIWIVSGIPGSGKSTVAHHLAASFPRSAHIEADRLQAMIVGGAVNPGVPPEDEQERQVQLSITHQCLLARSFADGGFTPVIDYVIPTRERLSGYRSQTSGYELNLVTLCPSVETVLERDRERPKTVAREWVHLREQMTSLQGGMGLWVDSTDLSVEETVSRILADREAARLGSTGSRPSAPRPAASLLR